MVPSSLLRLIVHHWQSCAEQSLLHQRWREYALNTFHTAGASWHWHTSQHVRWASLQAPLSQSRGCLFCKVPAHFNESPSYSFTLQSSQRVGYPPSAQRSVPRSRSMRPLTYSHHPIGIFDMQTIWPPGRENDGLYVRGSRATHRRGPNSGQTFDWQRDGQWFEMTAAAGTVPCGVSCWFHGRAMSRSYFRLANATYQQAALVPPPSAKLQFARVLCYAVSNIYSLLCKVSLFNVAVYPVICRVRGSFSHLALCSPSRSSYMRLNRSSKVSFSRI